MEISTVLQEIKVLFESQGDSDYFGEEVSQFEHAAQALLLAQQADASLEIQAAAFLHDIGHLLPDGDRDIFGRKDHEWAAADWLQKRGIAGTILRVIENHVNAKRYLCHKEPAYFHSLSDASKSTLLFQGGMMTAEEAQSFENDPDFQAIIALRKWDEQAKETDVKLPNLDQCLAVVAAYLEEYNWSKKMQKFTKLKNSVMKKILVLVFISLQIFAQKTERVILITTDGLRWQEVFKGADPQIIANKNFTEDSAKVARKYLVGDSKQNREILLPFMWSEIVKNGQIYGNRTLGNLANVKNSYGFSYPGYNEILTGYPDDSVNSNNKKYNQNITFLEFLNNQAKYKGKVAAFGTWDVFPYIVNDKRSGIPVNAGRAPLQGELNSSQQLLNELQRLVPSLASDRQDFITYLMAKEHLKRNKPDVLFIAFDETDEYAHEAKYREYLQAATNFDTFVKDLWEYCQQDPYYAGKTTFILTTDHGRGDADKNQWTSHGQKVPDCGEIWAAFLGPDVAAKGEIKEAQQIYQNQIAATAVKLLGQDFKNEKPIGKAISLK